MTTKDFGAGVSGYLDPEGRNWETSVYQASKPVLDKELNLVQDVSQYKDMRLRRRAFPSGWLAGDPLSTSDMTAAIWTASTTANELEIPQDLYAYVNGWLIRVGSTNATSTNLLDLGAGPAGAGAKRTDIVILEVWRKLLSASPDVDGKSPAGRIWWFGNVKIDAADDVTLNFADDILDASLGSESTKRVQIQYRLRVVQGIDPLTYPNGIDDPALFAHSVPPAAATPDGTVTAFNYASQSGSGDPGLWRAGDGNPANTLGTVDGYMYAVPLMAVVRRNTTAFARLDNHNGGVADPGPSDRPDGLFYDIVADKDIIDLRLASAPEGWNYREVMEKNLQFLFDNKTRTELTRTLIGGGVDGNTVLWADEIPGPMPGDGSTTGDTPGAQLIGTFDNIRRRFSDRVILETAVIRIDGGGVWANNDVVTIDPSNLRIHPYSAFNWASLAPTDISIVDVDQMFFGTSGIGREPIGTDHIVSGVGAVPQGSISIDVGTVPAAVLGNSCILWVFVVISYPAGQGLTKTPVEDFAADSFSVNNPAQLKVASPVEYDADEYINLYHANREVEITYRTLATSFIQKMASPILNQNVILPERIAGAGNSGINSILVNGGPYGGAAPVVDDAGYTITLTGLLAGQVVTVDYDAVRPYFNTPDAGGAQPQMTVYYNARAPQTVLDGRLVDDLTVTPRYIAPYVYVITAGSGAQEEAYPFPSQYVQTGGVYPGSGGTFSGDHELDGSSKLYVANFSADTGFIKLETKIPMVPAPEKLVFNRVGGDVDAEGRTYYKAVPGGEYAPTAFAQPLSDPKKHKVIQPLLAELTADHDFGRKGQLVLVLISRWATFDDENMVGFAPLLVDNTTTASIYRVKGNLLNNRRS